MNEAEEKIAALEGFGLTDKNGQPYHSKPFCIRVA
jgi:hypothetical protein